jgi:hypothetical protein
MDISILPFAKTRINDTEAIRFLEITEENDYISTAVEVIRTHLLLHGLDVKSNSNKNVDERFRYAVKTDWSEFLQNAAIHLIAMGYVVISKGSDEYNSGDKKNFTSITPICVPRELYSVEVELSDNSKPVYSVVFNTSLLAADSKKNNLSIHFLSGREPNPVTGSHRSIIKSILPIIKSLERKELNYDIATEQRSHPPLLYQQMPAKAPEPDDGMSSIHFNHKMNSVSKGPRLATTERNKKRKRSLVDLRDDKRRVYEPYDQTIDDNADFVPSGYEIAGGGIQMPEASSDLLAFFDMTRDKIFAKLQIPVTMVYPQLSSKLGTSPNINIDDSNTHLLNRTLSIYKLSLERIMLEFYKDAYKEGADDIKFILRIFTPLTITQVATLEDLDYIERGNAAELIVQAAGLPDEYVFMGKNEHKRPRIGGNENMTAQMITARTDNINKESDLFQAQIEKMGAEIKQIKHEILHPTPVSSG